MIINKNILLVSDNNEIKNLIETKLMLLRASDYINSISTIDLRKTDTSMYYVVILHAETNNKTTLKTIELLKKKNNYTQVILLLNEVDTNLIIESYDKGIFDYITINSETCEIMVKVLNAIRLRNLEEESNIKQLLLEQQGITEARNGLYKYKYLKEIYPDLASNKRIQSGTFVLLTIDENSKTRISTNRLAKILKNELRSEDIISTARDGIFYIIFPNTAIESLTCVIDKIQSKLGDKYPLKAGLTKIRNGQIDFIEKIANDSLLSAIQKETQICSIENNNVSSDSWLEEDTTPKKYKLFNNIFKTKLNTVIIPLFFRYQKEFEAKFKNTKVSQYANDIECIFSLKNEKIKSELVIRYECGAKFDIEINHSGLSSADNTKESLTLIKMDEKYLTNLFNKLKKEYKESLNSEETTC